MMTFAEARCPILACRANKGKSGVFCGYIVYGLPCGHPRYRARWREAVGYEDPPAAEALRPHSLTTRVASARRASTSLTSERARQLALQMEVER